MVKLKTGIYNITQKLELQIYFEELIKKFANINEVIPERDPLVPKYLCHSCPNCR